MATLKYFPNMSKGSAVVSEFPSYLQKKSIELSGAIHYTTKPHPVYPDQSIYYVSAPGSIHNHIQKNYATGVALSSDELGVMKEDVPANSMAGGAIGTKDMGLGGAKIHLLKREILSSVLGRVRARLRTKRI